MSATELKTDINSYLDRVDESFLRVVHSMLNTYIVEQEKQKEILGYDVHGNPKYVKEMKEIYEREIKAAIEKEEYVTLDDLEKELEE